MRNSSSRDRPGDAEARGLDAVDLPILPSTDDVGASSHDRFVAWMKSNPTSLEKRVWKLLGGEKNVWGFVPQAPLHGYIVDFLSEEYKLIIEADGPNHIKTGEQDMARDAALEKAGYLTLRLTPGDFSIATNTMLFDLIDYMAGAKVRMQDN